MTARDTTRTLVALVVGQVCLHACMAGTRMAAPLLALRDGHAAWAVGLLLGLFAVVPIALALTAGRLADRYGYHRPMWIAIALTVTGGLLAVLATVVTSGRFGVLCLAAAFAGAGANFGLITIQRTAGRSAADATELKRVFSWLGLAPALANVAGPVLAGALIDHAGFRAAFAALSVLPAIAWWWARRVPVEAVAATPSAAKARSSWELLAAPGFRRLLLVNWLLSSSWDVHSFLVPILGHERGFSASAIGLVLGVFATSVAAIRVAIPSIAHRLRESVVLVGAMLTTTAVFLVYPFAQGPWVMGVCASVLGLALGAVQPMIMATLHQITPDQRHGEAIALRSMTINLSSALMPFVFGFAGAALGASWLFWLMAGAVGAGSVPARRIGEGAGPRAP
ncbi:MFS transporter [Piscinibacter koreensis]|uniref:MFS transporter n=1 Tax=Piscinibacter koreensis TaxID=2742824 RepID=A0A7Y6NKV1_9BURK|nr:MFS transporter [Schlegelella koreensis]NUZ05068.1 MFS transporter [Schlegelella koreensis]